MKLKELAKKEFKNTRSESLQMIAIWKEGEESCSPDYADEILETSGSKEVKDYRLFHRNGYDVLVVELKED